MGDVLVTQNTKAADLKMYIEKVLAFHGVSDMTTKQGILLKDVVFGIVRESLVKDENARDTSVN